MVPFTCPILSPLLRICARPYGTDFRKASILEIRLTAVETPVVPRSAIDYRGGFPELVIRGGTAKCGRRVAAEFLEALVGGSLLTPAVVKLQGFGTTPDPSGLPVQIRRSGRDVRRIGGVGREIGRRCKGRDWQDGGGARGVARSRKL
jgi:hypothetical protein